MKILKDKILADLIRAKPSERSFIPPWRVAVYAVATRLAEDNPGFQRAAFLAEIFGGYCPPEPLPEKTVPDKIIVRRFARFAIKFKRSEARSVSFNPTNKELTIDLVGKERWSITNTSLQDFNRLVDEIFGKE